ncbi:intracellular protein transport protein USO1-like [Diaphorina citri]|uniref:Intracellular protein transport protein USO1-like n=1 Tax=Diaphorina citri TaxID=121845 RepID=A0A1S4EAP1_DIACI|nr:intracellular protein transport protein USO1-like [Diaphorina citri]
MHTPAIIESEDEWNDMAQRFKKEGIDYNNLKVEHKLLYVWRWLVDSEINLKNSRRMLDKLHEQQHEEIEEMENYVGKIRDQVQKQKEDLKDETDRLVEQVRSLRKLLADHDIQNDNLVDAVRIVLEERKRFSNELEILKSTKFGFYAMSTLDGGDNEPSQADEMLAEIIKVSSERELLKREVTEMNDRIEMLERSARQSELDNEKLAFKLSETLAELEDKEALLGEPQILCMRSHNNSNKSTLRRRLLIFELTLLGRKKSVAHNGQDGSEINLKNSRRMLDKLHEQQHEEIEQQQQKGIIIRSNNSRSSSIDRSISSEKISISRNNSSISMNSSRRSKQWHKATIKQGLVDSEINLKNSRRMLDKLHEQQHEEIEEMENYVGKIRDQVQKQKEDLKDETDRLVEQEMENYVGKIRDQVQKQKEDLKDETDRLVEQVRSLRKLLADHDIQNDNLVDANADSVPCPYCDLRYHPSQIKGVPTATDKFIDGRGRADCPTEVGFLGPGQCQIETLQSQLSVQRQRLRAEEMFRKQVETDYRRLQEEKRAIASRADSTPPSLLVSELQSFGSPRKLTSLLDSCNELARLEEMKRLQTECDSLRGHITVLGDKYNTLALRHIQYKAKRKFQLEELRGRLDAGQCQIETLQSQLSVQRQRLRAEEMFRKQVETDYRRLQEEKRAIASRLLNTEMDQREMQRELSILQKKISLLDNTNSELLARLLRLKYRDGLGVSSAGNSTAMGIPKSTTCDNVTSTWSNL